MIFSYMKNTRKTVLQHSGNTSYNIPYEKSLFLEHHRSQFPKIILKPFFLLPLGFLLYWADHLSPIKQSQPTVFKSRGKTVDLLN